MQVEDLGAPMDVLWFRVARKPTDPIEPVGSFGAGHILVGINRGDYWQCGFVIAKGTLETVKAQGLDTIRGAIAQLAPFLADRTGEIRSFDDFKQLTVGVDRLVLWHKCTVHRRRGAHDVAHRGRRHQSRRAGRGGSGQHSRPSPARGAVD